MRIAQVVTSIDRGGAEVLARDLSCAFAEQGHPSAIIALVEAEDIGGSSMRSAAMLQELAEAGVAAFSLNLGARRNTLAGLRRMRAAIREFRPDILHCHTARGIQFAAFSTLPKLYTHHNSKVPFSIAQMRVLERLTVGFIGIGQQCAADLACRTAKPITIIPNATRMPLDQPTPRSAQSPLRFCCLGNIQEQKNYPLLVETVALLKQRLPADQMPKFEVAGGGHSLAEMNALSAYYDVADVLEFLGPTNGADQVLARNDILLNCSLWEGLPISMIEAALAGLPIIATRTGDVPMAVHDGRNGRLVEPGDGDALFDVLFKAATQGIPYARWSATSREIGADFSLENCVKKHLRLYREVSTKSGGKSV